MFHGLCKISGGFLSQMLYHLHYMTLPCMLTDSVQKSLEAKFSSGQAGAIPITPSPEFHSRIAVSYNTLHVCK